MRIIEKMQIGARYGRITSAVILESLELCYISMPGLVYVDKGELEPLVQRARML